MSLRGLALAEHVAASLRTDKTAAEIAADAKYTHVERCAHSLARARYAPLAKRLLVRHRIDLLNAPDPEPEPEIVEPRKRGRAARTAEEILDELTDMAACGLTFDQAAERLGIKPHSLRCSAYSKGLTSEMRALFPDKFRPKFSDGDLVARLIELAESGESFTQAAGIIGLKPESLAQRLRTAGAVDRVKVAFGGESLRRRGAA